MTTIAFDGKTLAADSAVCSQDVRFGTMEKIVRLDDGRLLAIAGNMALTRAIADWLNGGEKPKLSGDAEKVQGIIVHPDGRAEEISENLRIWSACVPWAGGSGEVPALVAMRLGKTAAEAVEVACQFDVWSSGPVQAIRVVEPDPVLEPQPVIVDPALPPHQQRVVQEHMDLVEKVTKLGAFLDGQLFKSLPGKEQFRLQKQYDVMLQYRDILAERIAAF